MIWRRRLTRSVLTLAVFAVACRGDGESGDVRCAECGPYGDVLGALCDTLERCPQDAYPIAYRSRSECVEILAFLLTCRLEEDEVADIPNFRVEQHIPEVDEAGARACAAWLESASCDSVYGQGSRAETSPCEGLLVVSDEDDEDRSGQGMREGDLCERGSCAEGLYCSRSEFVPEEQALTCAVCTPLPKGGEACDVSGGNCAEGFYCGRVDQAAECLPLDQAGAPCTAGFHCASGFCNPNTMTCDPGGKDGDACGAEGDCRAELFCSAVLGSCETKRRNGETCTADPECTTAMCHEETGQCGLPDGAECRRGADYLCASAFCDRSSNTCRPLRANGDPCESEAECASRYCASGTHTCAERCFSDDECPADRFCSRDIGMCLAKRADGERCDDEEDCASGWCGSDERCARRPGIGDACSRSFDCYPLGYCSGGACVRRKSPGETCSAIDECQDPYLCMDGRCERMFLECRPAPSGELCTYLRLCDESAYCDIPAFVCRPRKKAGESCSSTFARIVPNECSDGLYCDGATQACAGRAPEGAPCASEAQCTEGLHCIERTSGRICAQGPEGQPCDEWEAPCPAGFFCARDDTCHAPGADGADCHADVECIPGYYCDFGDGCMPRPGLGGECWTNIPCSEPYYCDLDTRTCQPDAGRGESCETSSYGVECAQGFYCDWDSALSMSICKSQKAAGDPCQGDEECSSGACRYVSESYQCLATAECSMR